MSPRTAAKKLTLHLFSILRNCLTLYYLRMKKLVKFNGCFKLIGLKGSICVLLVYSILSSCTENLPGNAQNQSGVKDLKYFLHRLHTLDHLPELENSHTAMSSTWDTTGGNFDGNCFKNIQGNKNVLLDVDGPGCVNRIFTGVAYKTYGTRIQVFIDNDIKPVYDMEVSDFFDPHTGPFPYPLVFQKTYPGILFPIPFSEHIKIQLVIEHPNTQIVFGSPWGNFWQIVYTNYSHDSKIKSLQLPLNHDEQKELDDVCKAWLIAESVPPKEPLNWMINKNITIEPGKTGNLNYQGCGVIKEMRIAVGPNTDNILLNTRMKIRWDGLKDNSVDVPLGYFFGNADYQNQKKFSSLLLGISEKNVYSRFPMPFDKGFTVYFENQSKEKIENLQIMIDIERMETLPENFGRFHATWNEILLDSMTYKTFPRYGKSTKPHLDLLDVKNVRGKYVGNLLHVAWPYTTWWGEGDWLIWSDETGFPPSYHGTGSEEYYNSGWSMFDRKAISGYITQLPANVYNYSFHLNDNFQFQQNLKVAVEIWWLSPPEEIFRSIYGSTAFWYAYPAQDANSKQFLIVPRLKHNTSTNEFKWN